MILRSTRNNGLLATLFAGLISFSVGCIIVGGNGNGDGPNDCGSLLDNNYIGNDGFCYCEQNHAWCNPNDDLDLSCCEIDPMDPVDGTCGNNSYLADDGLCYCEQDYDWCSKTGLDCCPLDPKDPTDTGGAGTTGSGTTGAGTSAGPNCTPEEPPAGLVAVELGDLLLLEPMEIEQPVRPKPSAAAMVKVRATVEVLSIVGSLVTRGE